MASPSSSTEVCNLALDYLSQKPITDIENPSTDEENICARWYDSVRRRVLRLHSWNFAIKRAQLAKITTAPSFGYDGYYAYPTDLVRMISIVSASTDADYNKDIDYEIEGNHILASIDSAAALNIRYVSDYTNVQGMDALFVDLLAIELALRMAYKFTNGNSDVQRLKALRDDAVSEAHGVDGQERPIKRVQSSTALNSRKQQGSFVDTTRYGGAR